MLFTSPVLAEASGRIAGLIFSHNAGGQYIRSATTVTNPNTPAQQVVRGLLSQLTSLWVDTLTQLQRDAWETYADNVSVLNRLGNPINLSGLNMYVRTNVPLIQAGFARQDDAPTIFSLGDFTLPSGIPSEASQALALFFTITDDWVGEDDAGMLVYVSRPQNPSINFFKGPYRFAGSIDGDGITPPTTPAAILVPFPIVAGQRLFFRVQVVRADGRLSADAKLQAEVVA